MVGALVVVARGREKRADEGSGALHLAVDPRGELLDARAAVEEIMSREI